MENLISMLPDLKKAVLETLSMLAIGLTVSTIIGGIIGVFLYLWKQERLLKNTTMYLIVGGIVNIIRSFPFVILMIAAGPIARTVVGTTIGPIAASVPLSIAGIAYFARLVELALLEVPRGTIEAAQSMGATIPKIVFSVLLREARSPLILGFTTLTISYLSYSSAAGIIGGGGVGDLAIRYGYYRFQTDIMITTVVGLVLFVQILQMTGNYIARVLDKR
ncbi:MAG: ABC transporter permease [Bdellovibrionales bacterium]|nr:ABC transporter permease [Bdellovibrionales bacterium]